MRALIFTAGSLVSALGFAAHATIGDPGLFQGALTLGGGWIICGLFFVSSKWHGIIGAGVLALLAAGRCLTDLLQSGASPAAPFQIAAMFISLVVLTAAVRSLLAERRRRQIAELKGEDSQG